MPCLCSANTLRLFIRSVAQIDVSTTVPRYPTQLRKGALRNFTTTRTVALQSSLSWKTVSTSALSLSPTENSNAETPTRPDVDSTGQQLSNNHTFDLNSAVLEISPETIDALAAESRFTAPRSYGEFQSDESDGYTWRIERGEGSARSGPIKPTFRRTKVQNTSLAIHFDNPRAPVLKPPTTYSQAPLLNRRDNRPDYKEYRQGLKGSRSEYGEREYSKPERSQPKDDWTPPSREDWMIQKAALKDKIEGGWNPMKRLSPDALAGIRALHAQMPEIYTTATLAENFKISPEAIRRILKSKWVPKQEEEIDRSKRWFKRGEKVWDRWAEQGKKPPKQWRQYGRGQWKMVVRGGKERKQWVPASSTSGSSGFLRRSENTATTKSPDYPVTTRRSDFPVTAKADTIPWG